PAPPTPPPPALPADVDLVGRFDTAAAALTLLGRLTGMHAGDATTVRHHPGDGAYWLSLSLPVGLGRELVATCGGRGYLPRGQRPDRGWGLPAPRAGARPVPATGLVQLGVVELVRRTGLYEIHPELLPRAVVLAPGCAVAAVVRRALELGLRSTHHPVELRPL